MSPSRTNQARRFPHFVVTSDCLIVLALVCASEQVEQVRLRSSLFYQIYTSPIDWLKQGWRQGGKCCWAQCGSHMEATDGGYGGLERERGGGQAYLMEFR